MSDTKYLYAAAVQGIQDFIFATDVLKEIAGASELVAQICDEKFKETLGGNYKAENLLIGAAGNIKYLFDNEEDCAKVVKEFPFIVAEIAPGITISQTVIKIEGEINSCHIDTAERNLKIQRNLAMRPGTMGWMIAKRVPKTGLPVVDKDKVEGDGIDNASRQKIKAYKEIAKKSLFVNLMPEAWKDLLSFEEGKTAYSDSSWIAVVYADGNDLGKLIQSQFKGLTGSDLVEAQQKFSLNLDTATRNAAKMAFQKVFDGIDSKTLESYKDKHILPFRPIVCGGDDLTVIIHAEYALKFTEYFLQEFEKNTKLAYGNNGLTACAGIAYITQKYPFHYGVELADELCKHAKTEAKKLGKELTPSCLSFYKIESSFVRSYEEIEKSELKANAISKTLSNCPYYLDGQYRKSVESLKKWIAAAKDKKAIASRLRQVLSMVHTETKETIEMELSRIETLNKKDFKVFDIDVKNVETLTHLHDFLSLNSFQK